MNIEDIITPRLFDSPEYFLRDFNFSSCTARFVRMNRDCYRKSTFHDRRVQHLGDETVQVGLPELFDLLDSVAPSPAKTNYLFHTAFCCSTLLSRALDIPNRTFVLREPHSLTQLAAVSGRAGAYPEMPEGPWNRLMDLVAVLHSRGFGVGEAPLVKPSDCCNNIVPGLLARHPDSYGLLLYSDLRGFLSSTLRNEDRRAYIKRELPRAVADLRACSALAELDTSTLTTAERAACLWLSQMYLCRAQLECNNSSLRSLEARTLLARPLDAMRAVSGFFDLELSDDLVREIVQGPVFNTHSKNPARAYNDATRAMDMEQAVNAFGDEIEEGLVWAASISGDYSPGSYLPEPLLE